MQHSNKKSNPLRLSWKSSYLLFCAILLISAYSVLINYMTANHTRTDSYIVYTSGWLLNQGDNPYIRNEKTIALNPTKHRKTVPNLSPPFTTMLVSIAGHWISEAQFSFSMRIINILASLITIALLTRYFFRAHRWQFFFTISVLNFAFMATVYTFSFGELTLLLNLLLISSFILYSKNTKLTDSWVGIILAFAINIKLFFGLFIFLFIGQKRYYALASVILFASILALIPIIFYGLAPYSGYLKALGEIDWYPVNWNASYLGILCRIFGDATARFQSIWHLPWLTYTLYYGLFVLYIPFLLILSKRLINQPATVFSLFISSMLLLSPLGWYYYFPLLLLPVLHYFYQIHASKNHYLPQKAYLSYLFGLLGLLLIMNMPYGMQRTDTTSLLFQLTMGSYLFVCLFIFHCLQLKLMQLNRQHPIIDHATNPTNNTSHKLDNRMLYLLFSVIFIISTSVGFCRFMIHKPDSWQESKQDTQHIDRLN